MALLDMSKVRFNAAFIAREVVSFTLTALFWHFSWYFLFCFFFFFGSTMYVDEDHEAKVLYEAKMERYKTSLNIKRADDFPYIPNSSYISELDYFCDLQAAKVIPLKSNIMQVLSKPGFGKSALLHYWVLQRQLSIKLAQGSGSFLFTHFVNSSQDEKLSDMLGSLEYELKSHFHLRNMTLRKTANQRRWDLPRFLDAANRKSRGVIP